MKSEDLQLGNFVIQDGNIYRTISIGNEYGGGSPKISAWMMDHDGILGAQESPVTAFLHYFDAVPMTYEYLKLFHGLYYNKHDETFTLDIESGTGGVDIIKLKPHPVAKTYMLYWSKLKGTEEIELLTQSFSGVHELQNFLKVVFNYKLEFKDNVSIGLE